MASDTSGVLEKDKRDRICDFILQGDFPAAMGLKLAHAEVDYCRIVMPVSKTIMNAVGIVHGGATAALLDTAATAAAWASNALGSGARGTTVGFSVNFLSSSKDADVIADARVVRRGGSLVVIDVNISDTADRLVAKGTVTYKLSTPGKPASVPHS